jgi:hypothetical protein
MNIISVCPGEHKIIVIFTIGIKESGENGNKTSNHTITKKLSINIQTNIGSELQCHQSQCCNWFIYIYRYCCKHLKLYIYHQSQRKEIVFCNWLQSSYVTKAFKKGMPWTGICHKRFRINFTWWITGDINTIASILGIM